MRFSILGPLLVHDATGRPITIGGARLRTLLSLLLLRPGRRITTDELTEAIWAGSPPASAGNALQALVSRLRRILGDGARIDGDASGYRIRADPGQVDLSEFEALAARGRARLASGCASDAERDLGEALALWRGPALADLTARGIAEDIALRLTETHRAALEDHLEARVEMGGHAEALPEAEALASREPHRERPVELLVRALAGTGRTADALAAYDRFRAHLADDLGLDPSPQLQNIHLRLLRGELDAPSPPVPESVPRPQLHLPVILTSFVPREAEVDTAVDLLTEGRLVTLIGPGGAGKTRLAIETASALVARAPHLVMRGGWFVELASRTGADIPDALADTLELRRSAIIQSPSTASVAPPLERVVSFIGDQSALIVLDNCEHLVSDVVRTVAPLLARCPHLRVLATSREPLAVPGEQLLPVPSLALPPEGVTAERAATYPSVVLFAERASAVRPDFSVGPGNVAHVVRVTRELDGMPLALELAAARLRSMTAAQLADRLSDRFRLLTGGTRAALPRHRTLRAVVDWSWELLDEPERLLLRRLSIFAGGATLEAVERVCADPGTVGTVEGHDVWTVLFALVDKSLVAAETPAHDGVPPRYRQLETVRAYAAERLTLSGEEERLRDEHARYVRDLWCESDPLLRGPRQVEVLVRLDAEADNCGAAVRWALERGDTGLALDLVEYTQWYWTLAGAWRKLARWSEDVLEMVGDRVPEGRAVAYAGCLFHRVADGTVGRGAALERFGLIDEVLDEAGERAEEHHMLVYGLVYRSLLEGRPERAYEQLEGAMDQPDPWMRAMIRLLLSLLDAVSGEAGRAMERVAEALEAFRECGDVWGECQALAQATDVHRFSDLERCRELLTDGMRMSADAGLTGMAAVFRIRRAQVLTDLGELDAAHEDLKALSAFEEPVQEEHRVLLQMCEAQWLRASGDLEAARVLVDRLGVSVSRLGGFSLVYIEAAWRAVSANVAWASGDTGLAWREAGRAWWLVAHGLGPLCAEVLDVFATMLAEEDPGRAALLLGYSEELRGVPDTVTPSVVRARERAREKLGAEEYVRLVAEARGAGADRVHRLVGEWLAPIVPEERLTHPERHL